MGNICRSPTAQGVMEKLLAEQGLADAFSLDSAGTHAYHVGNPPDARSQKHALRRGVDLSGQRARQVRLGDFDGFDLIVAMDRSNYQNLLHICPPEYQNKVQMMLSFSPALREQGKIDVQDPYYEGERGFEQVLDDLELACAGLLTHCLAQDSQETL